MNFIVANYDQSGIFLDYDGTLAHIADYPMLALPVAGVNEVITKLALSYAKVALISGRPVDFLLEKFPVHFPLETEETKMGKSRTLQLYGMYGIQEVARDGSIVVHSHPQLLHWQSVVEKARLQAIDELPKDIYVEPKQLSFTLHWRRKPELADQVASFAKRVSIQFALEVLPARMAIELRAPLGIDKGTIVAKIAQHLKAVAYFGDDQADLPAFDTLDKLAKEGIVTVKITAASNETPKVLLESADIVVQGPNGVLELLKQLEPSL